MYEIFRDSINYSVKELESAGKELKDFECENVYALLSADTRAGAVKLGDKLKRRAEKYNAECERVEHMRSYEESLYREYSYTHIAGIDEVGRGPLFGPVVAAAVILPKDSRILYINDSKKLSAARREQLDAEIRAEAVSVGIGCVDNNTIDEINILNATKQAMLSAVAALSPAPDCLLIDAVELDSAIPQHPIISGDANIYSIGAASIVAKVYRDRLLDEYAKIYPEYHLEQNKGYGTAEHIAAIERFGATPLHRKSFIAGLNYTPADLGARCESFACKYLTERGYVLRERNYRAVGGEIDLIMQEEEQIVFLEIKGRTEGSLVDATYSVGSAKRARIIAAAKVYMEEHANYSARFDVLTLSYDENRQVIRSLKHYKNAFSAR